MAELSIFKSRKGSLSCSPEEVYEFVTDVRNFRRFVPEGTINDLQIEKESCSFNIPGMGSVNMHLAEKEPWQLVTYRGTVFKTNEYSLMLSIVKNSSGKADVVVTLESDLNPFVKMLATQPVTRFLETLIVEMEKFRDWK